MPRMLEDQIAWNKRKSYALMIIVPVILVALIYVFGSFYMPTTSPFFILSIGIVISLAYVLGSYFWSDKLVLSSVNAQEADPNRHKKLYDMMEGLTLASGMEMPDLYVQDSSDINAFATGRNPENAKICVTNGAMQRLSDDELEGVLAHELAHVQNRDVMFMTLVVALIGIISILSEMFLHSLWFGSDDRKPPYLIIVGLILAVLAPIVARLVQLAISRKREYLADASGAKMTRYPDGLANALEKIQQQNQGMKVNKAVSSLYFANPFTKHGKALLSTHPPIEERVSRLRQM